MLHRAIALCFGVAFFCMAAAQALASGSAFSDIAPGAYQAGDSVRFSLDRYRQEFLLRFAGQPEVFVLYANFGSLGGRVLMYDSGAVALQVGNWGGMTLYTDDHPEGMPISRVGDSSPPVLPQISMQQIQNAADDEAAHLGYVRGLHIGFAADPAAVGDATVRSLAFDAMENAARGIDRFTANPNARNLFGQRVVSVRMQASEKPTIKITDKVLIVTFNPRTGYLGRASSRAISAALGKVFAIPSN